MLFHNSLKSTIFQLFSSSAEAGMSVTMKSVPFYTREDKRRVDHTSIHVILSEVIASYKIVNITSQKFCCSGETAIRQANFRLNALLIVVKCAEQREEKN